MFHDIVELSPALSEDALTMVANLTEPGRVADFIAAALPGMASAEKQAVLETLNVKERMQDLVRSLGKRARGVATAQQDSDAGARSALRVAT